MDVTLSSYASGKGEVSANWECGVLSPALLWAFPVLSKAGCVIEYYPFGTVEICRPSFWPASIKNGPLDTEMPTHSDQGLRSLRDEANRCWDMAFNQMIERGEWLRLMGADQCMELSLLTPFIDILFSLKFQGSDETFQTLLDDLTEDKNFPETRLFGYLLCKNTAFRPLTEVPEWVLKLL